MNVVVTDRVERKAYIRGYRQFQHSIVDRDDEEIETDLAEFRDSKKYMNSVLPHLRALAGYDDRDEPDPYASGGAVMLVGEESLGDDPIEGERSTAEEYLPTLMQRWNDGARDALRGDEQSESL